MKKLLKLLLIAGLFVLPFTPPPSDVLASVPFEGWSLNGDEENLYDPGTEIGTDKAGDDYTVKLKAVYGEASDVKYAVSIYGIKQDKVQEPGKVAALTFGPATGANYTNSYKSCGSANCIHKLTWEQIIQKANENPSVFQSCLQNGCTKSVDLYLSDALKEKSYQDMTGDGVSSLCYSIKSEYRQFNDYNKEYASDITFKGGWPASRMRTTLNGEENCMSYTDIDEAGADLLSEQDALISAFPEELRQAIVPKAVRSNCKEQSLDSYASGSKSNNHNTTTYDKLWLFSSSELLSNVQHELAFPNENVNQNECYQRASKLGITLNNFGKLAGYNEESGQNYSDWYTRSVISYGIDDAVILILSSKGLGEFEYYYRDDYVNCGIAPGFCIGTADDPSPAGPTAVIYADYTMIFYEGQPDPQDRETRGGTIGNTFGYTGWLNDKYSKSEQVPWFDYEAAIHKVVFNNTFTPKSTAYWFYCAENLYSINPEGLNMQEATDTKYMFYKTYFSNLDLRSWDVSNVTDMKYMFANCSELTSLNLSGWNTKNVKDISYMFSSCYLLETIDLTGWDISGITDIKMTFGGPKSNGNICDLKTIYAGDWTVNPAIASASSVFSYCSLPGFDISKKGGDMCKPVSKGGYFTDPV